MFFGTFQIHIAKIYGILTMWKKNCASRCPQGAHHVALLFPTAGLWPFCALHWPASPECGFDCFFLSDSQQRAIAHRRLQQEHSTSPWFWLPVRARQFVKTALHVIKSGVERPEEAAWQLSSTLRVGSLFPGGQDIVCLGRTFFLIWGRRAREASWNLAPSYLALLTSHSHSL